ncbi:hypothetical protein LTR70_004733 [Exophiala xenobiotica]|uniref:Zn(2)-C6 fungal-type domain-containing protein n=1 Tax=Lithohypha guttulata TaxID=1690604 RepID=A0ABR0KCK3_9EURO|nr:hypothetical protein LTR24_004349 [Lithohypha guttulata]KAK5319947.1 hypothetical protein LTR70_004733 [Exophiala xenobiotica]
MPKLAAVVNDPCAVGVTQGRRTGNAKNKRGGRYTCDQCKRRRTHEKPAGPCDGEEPLCNNCRSIFEQFPDCTWHQEDAPRAVPFASQDSMQMSGAFLENLPPIDSTSYTGLYAPPLESEDMYGGVVAPSGALGPTAPLSHRSQPGTQYRPQAFPSRQGRTQTAQAQYPGPDDEISGQWSGYREDEDDEVDDDWAQNVGTETPSADDIEQDEHARLESERRGQRRFLYGGTPAPPTRTDTGAEKRGRDQRSPSDNHPSNPATPSAWQAPKRARQVADEEEPDPEKEEEEEVASSRTYMPPPTQPAPRGRGGNQRGRIGNTGRGYQTRGKKRG